MKKIDINYLKRRVDLLQQTASELKGVFKKFKNAKIPILVLDELDILEDLYLEIGCYSKEIERRLNKLKGGKHGETNRKKI